MTKEIMDGYGPKADENPASESEIRLTGVTFNRSMLNKGRIAPKDFVFLQAKFVDDYGGKQRYKYTRTQMIPAKLDEDVEMAFMIALAKDLKEEFKLQPQPKGAPAKEVTAESV